VGRFTQPENIAVKDWACQKCGKVSQEANKRLSIKRLPPVLSVQFKVSSSLPSHTKRYDFNDESVSAL
jgi:ubiquitin carboxyl-terminal hydrolase 22/27/51